MSKKHKFKPMLDKVIVKRDEPKEHILSSGLILPEICEYQGTDTLNMGTVLAVGPGLAGQEGLMEMEVGDRVVFIDEGLNFKVDGEKYLSLKGRLVLAKVEKVNENND